MSGDPAGGPLRVLHFAAGNLFGGVEALLRTVAESRDLCPGMASEFAVCFEDRLVDELREAGAEVHGIGGVRFRQPWTVWLARRRLAALLRERRADVVVGHGCWAHLISGKAGRAAGRSVVFWMHDRIGGTHWLERLAGRIVPDLVVANSRGTAETLPNIYPGSPCEVVFCPVRGQQIDRTEARRQVRGESGTPEGDVVVVIACRLERWKGHELLLDALARLGDRPGWTAWVVGGVQRPHERLYLDELRERVAAAGLADRVRFLGQRSDVPRVLAASDVHCQPNTGPEPFGIAFVEALYAGLPVVSTDMGGAAEIVTEDCGILVPPGDPVALAAALRTLMDDAGARARLGAAGPSRARALCDPSVVLGRLESVLREVVPGRSGVAAAVAGGRS